MSDAQFRAARVGDQSVPRRGTREVREQIERRADGERDEDQIGATYDELEWAMIAIEKKSDATTFTARQEDVMKIYKARHHANQHKMEAIPVCKIPKDLF